MSDAKRYAAGDVFHRTPVVLASDYDVLALQYQGVHMTMLAIRDQRDKYSTEVADLKARLAEAEEWRDRAQEELRLCQQDAIQLQARSAEADRRNSVKDRCVQRIMARLADLLQDDDFNTLERWALEGGFPYPPIDAARATDSAPTNWEDVSHE